MCLYSIIPAPCDLIQCENGATCGIDGANADCACVAGYTGARCQNGKDRITL